MSSGRLVELLDSIERRVEIMRSAVQALEVEKDTLVEVLQNFSDSPELQMVSSYIFKYLSCCLHVAVKQKVAMLIAAQKIMSGSEGK